MMHIATRLLIGLVIWAAVLTGVGSGPHPALAQFYPGSGAVGVVGVDKTSYQVGELAHVCYKPEPPGPLTLTRCLSITITLPAGTECVGAVAGGTTDQTCFQVFTQGSNVVSRFQVCGNLLVFTGKAEPGSDAEQCFLQSFQQCRPAALVVTLLEPYSRLNHTFSVQGEGGNCAISDAVQADVPPEGVWPVDDVCVCRRKQQFGGLALHVLRTER